MPLFTAKGLLLVLLSFRLATELWGETLHAVEADPLRMPQPGDHGLRVISPSVLELTLISTKDPDPAPVTSWNLGDNGAGFLGMAPGDYTVLVNGRSVAIRAVGAKRRILYAPIEERDLRIANHRYLYLDQPISLSSIQSVEVQNPNRTLWTPDRVFAATTDPRRTSPAIHVNQVGYVPSLPKKAMVGYYLGNLGELVVTSSRFQLVDTRTGAIAYDGPLTLRKDVGFDFSPLPYQHVLEADFSAFGRPGEYRLAVPGLGASLPFRIDEGALMAVVRAYGLGLYHQRCGTTNALPFTRFVHEACHTARAEIPDTSPVFSAAWKIITNVSAEHSGQTNDRLLHRLRDATSSFYPFVQHSPIDVSGGHHDAGDYSKYTINSAAMVHALMFAVDAFPRAAALDNLGIPESGDGVSDLLQEAKWEADFLAKMQDADGGFYFLVYPRDRRYENDVLPDCGDAQIVWPKNTTATAAAVAALAQCASSPEFKHHYPRTAETYLQKAMLGWNFLLNAIARHGKDGAYQKLTHYGANWGHDDELAWAACELYLATGNLAYRDRLFEWFPSPGDPNTYRWSWWRMSESWGNAIRSYAFGARSGRLPHEWLVPEYLRACETEILTAGEDALRSSQQSAYGTSFPTDTKRARTAGWYFSNDQAFDLTVAYQLTPRGDFERAVLENLNYEVGCNPVNISFLTGVGQRRPREIVHQFARNDNRVLPPSGLPIGNLQSDFDFLPLYRFEPGRLNYPADGRFGFYPLYDRWSDAASVTAEFVVVNSARSLGSLAFFAARTPASLGPAISTKAQIIVPNQVVPLGQPVTVRLSAPGINLAPTQIVWEARDQQPSMGTTYAIVPRHSGEQWVEAEIAWPDGRRIFAAGRFVADSPTVTWVDGAVPKGSITYGGNEPWNWVTSSAPPLAGNRVHQSTLAWGLHEHVFDNAASPLVVRASDTLFVYVHLNSEHPPREIMVHWNDGDWEHRAYWGENLITYGAFNTPGRFSMGEMPPTGKWVRLEVPAAAVGIGARPVKGMTFATFDGQATWGPAGRISPSIEPPVDNPPVELADDLSADPSSGVGQTFPAYEAIQDPTTVGFGPGY